MTADKQPFDPHRVVVKHSHDTLDTVSYTGNLVAECKNWIVIHATWVHGFYDIGCMTFHNGDLLTEYFSRYRPYNLFRVDREYGEFAGWYCNVTGPLEITGNEIHWHDLYIDVVLLPDSSVHTLDEDELQQSNLENTNPQLHRYILEARDSLIDLIRLNRYPISTTSAGSR